MKTMRQSGPYRKRCPKAGFSPFLTSAISYISGKIHTRRRRKSPKYLKFPPLLLFLAPAFLSMMLSSPFASPQPLSAHHPGKADFVQFSHSTVHLPQSSQYISRDPRQLLVYQRQETTDQASSSSESNMTLLAPSRTDRPNPLTGLSDWNGGWNPFSRDYWASLIWSGIPATLTGIVWISLGMTAGIGMVAMCLCCQPRWKEWRSREIKTEGRLEVLTIVLGVCAASLCIAGFVFLCRGQLDFWGKIEEDVEFVVNITTKATDVVDTVAAAMSKIASISFLGLRVPEHEKIQEIADKAAAGSAKAQEIVNNTQTMANQYISATVIVAITLSAVLLLLAVSIIVFAYWQWTLLFTIAICMLWFLCFFSLAMLTVWSDAHNFMGDTRAALEEVEANPMAPSVMMDIIPCMNNTLLNMTALQARRAVYEALNFVNNAWSNLKIPPIVGNILQAGANQLFNVSAICNPFDGPPDYLPNGKGCLPGVPSLQEVADKIAESVCGSSERLCDFVGTNVMRAEVAMLLAGAALDRLLPEFNPIASCAYLANIARILINFSAVYYEAISEAWLGYLLLCIGTMVLAIVLTVFILFGTSITPKHKDQSEEDPLPEEKVQELVVLEESTQEIPEAKPLSSEA